MNINSPLFNNHFIEVKTFYVTTFGKVPCIHFISELDVSEAYTHISRKLQQDILDTYQHAYFDHEKQRMLFNNTIFVLRENRIIELANNYAQILFAPNQYDWANRLTKELSACKKLNNRISPGTVTHIAAHWDDSDKRTAR